MIDEATKHARRADAKTYEHLNPKGEAKTIRKGFFQVPFWRCRPIKGHGSWQALPRYPENHGGST